MPLGDGAGRAGVDIAHKRAHGKAGRSARKSTLEESSRHVDELLTEVHARLNPNIDVRRTHLNKLWVNNGENQMVETKSIDEVLDYGDAREARVRRKIRDDSYTTTTMVTHLPLTMCEERWRKNDEGQWKKFYVPRDPDEFERWVKLAVQEMARIYPGGMAGMHGVALNMDETRPHLQAIGDTFAEDTGKRAKPGDLRIAFSDAFGSSRNVRRPEDGKMAYRKTKMSNFQTRFRTAMVEAGFPVEKDVDPVRSRRRHELAELAELSEQAEQLKRDLAAVANQRVETIADRERVRAQREKLREREAELLERQANLSKSQKKVERDAKLTKIARESAEGLQADAQNALWAAEGLPDVDDVLDLIENSVKAVNAPPAVLQALQRARQPARDLMTQKKRSAAAKVADTIAAHEHLTHTSPSVELDGPDQK